MSCKPLSRLTANGIPRIGLTALVARVQNNLVLLLDEQLSSHLSEPVD